MNAAAALSVYRENLRTLRLDERPHQARLVEMASAALSADGPRRRIVQAGTGVGKTLAALSVAATVGRAGNPALVVVGSNALLGQYVDAAQSITRGWSPVRTARVIGSRYYACASSPAAQQDGVPNDVDVPEWDEGYSDAVAEVREHRDVWLAEHCQPRWTTQFERTEDMDESFACPGARIEDDDSEPEHDDDQDDDATPDTVCAGGFLWGCGRRAARIRARDEADIVLTNTDLLVIHARLGGTVPILPDVRAVTIVDEAHQLADKTAEILSVALGPRTGRRKFAPVEPPRDREETPDECAEREARNDAAATVRGVIARYRIRELARPGWPERRDGDRAARADPLDHEDSAALRDLLGLFDDEPAAESAAEPAAGTEPATDERASVLNTVRLLIRTPDERTIVPTVYRPPDAAAEIDDERRPDTVYLRRADVSQFVRGMLGEPAVLLSATVGASLPRQVGWPDAEPLDVGHPFDYARQTTLWVSQHDGTKAITRTATRARRDHLARLRAAELAEFVAPGAALVLCSANADVRLLVRLLTPTLTPRGVRLFVQPLGEGSVAARAVAAEFLAHPGPAVLLGTASYATGLDIPGNALRRVAWWTLPIGGTEPVDEQRVTTFRPPDAPRGLSAAQVARWRGSYLDDRRRITVAQGMGRLIRRVTDSGEFLLCDNRFEPHLRGARGIVDRHLGAIPRQTWPRADERSTA